MNPVHLNPQRMRDLLDAMRGKAVLVLGDVMLDRYLEGRVERISPEGPVPVVDVSRRDARLGGAANVARNLASLGAEPLLATVLGADETGEELKEILARRGIDAEGIIEDAGRPTTVKTRVLGSGQQICRFDEESRDPLSESVLAELRAKTLEALKRSQAVILSDYGKGVMNDDLVTELIAEAKVQCVPVVVDPKEGHFSAYRGADLVTPNAVEAGGSFGQPIRNDQDVETVGRGLLTRLDLGALMITLGADGIALFESGAPQRRFPAKARKVFDVTGAGDTVVSVLGLSMAAGAGLDEGARLANLAASIVVGRVGTDAPSIDELMTAALDEILDGRETEKTPAPGRVLSREEASEWAEQQRQGGRGIVFTNGCFDVLHFGHLAILREAARHGDLLVVGMNSDASVKRLKGPKRPVNPEAERARLLAHLSPVDAVVIFEEDTPLEIIRELKPSALVKGDEYEEKDIVGAEDIRSWGGEVIRFPMQEGFSTTETLKKMEEHS